MKVKPILFSAPMVRALLAGTKTQTRRVIAVQPPDAAKDAGVIATSTGTGSHGLWSWLDSEQLDWASTVGDDFRCPYGVPGDLLYMRETFRASRLGGDPGSSTFGAAGSGCSVDYIADGAGHNFNDPDWRDAFKHEKNRPAIHMPRWVSRLTLRITDVRVQRLQDITDADSIAEGIERDEEGNWRDYAQEGWGGTVYPRRSYESLWESINGRDSWPSNPWVWVVHFETIHENVDTYLKRIAA